jgi:hypothetical protein
MIIYTFYPNQFLRISYFFSSSNDAGRWSNDEDGLHCFVAEIVEKKVLIVEGKSDQSKWWRRNLLV